MFQRFGEGRAVHERREGSRDASVAEAAAIALTTLGGGSSARKRRASLAGDVLGGLRMAGELVERLADFVDAVAARVAAPEQALFAEVVAVGVEKEVSRCARRRAR